MAFDLLLTFRHVPTGTSISGYLSGSPLADSDTGVPVDEETAKAARDELQEVFVNGNLNQITLFTRRQEPLFDLGKYTEVADRRAQEVSIPKSILKDCVMASQLIEVKE